MPLADGKAINSLSHLRLKGSGRDASTHPPALFPDLLRQRFDSIIESVRDQNAERAETDGGERNKPPENRFISTMTCLLDAKNLKRQRIAAVSIGRTKSALSQSTIVDLWNVLVECLGCESLAPLRSSFLPSLKILTSMVPNSIRFECFKNLLRHPNAKNLNLLAIQNLNFLSEAELTIGGESEFVEVLDAFSNMISFLMDPSNTAISREATAFDSLSRSFTSMIANVVGVSRPCQSPSASVFTLCDRLCTTIRSPSLHRECYMKLAIALILLLSHYTTPENLSKFLSAFLEGSSCPLVDNEAEMKLWGFLWPNKLPILSQVSMFAELALCRVVASRIQLSTLCMSALGQQCNEVQDRSVLTGPLLRHIFKLCHQEQAHFRSQAFLLLAVWIDRVVRALKKEILDSHEHFSIDHALENVLTLMIEHWDSKVSAVSRSLRTVFEAWARAFDQSIKSDGDTDDMSSAGFLLKRLLDCSTGTKARFDMLKMMLPRLSALKLVHLCPELLPSLLRIGSDRSGNGVSDTLLVAILEKLQREIHSSEHWLETWLHYFVDALLGCSNRSLDRLRSHLLPAVLRLNTASLPALINAVEERQDVPPSIRSRAIITLATTGRKLAVVEFDRLLMSDTFVSHLERALMNKDESIRLDGLDLICTSRSTTRLPTSPKLSLLRRSIPTFFKLEQSASRSRFIHLVQKLLLRIRNGLSRKLPVSPSAAEECNSFVNWLFHELARQLYPGAAFERMTTALEAFLVFLQLFPAMIDVALVNRFLATLSCSWERVRVLCFRVLTSPALRGGLPGYDSVESLRPLVDRAANLARSSYCADADAGSVLMALLFDRFVQQCGWRLPLALWIGGRDDLQTHNSGTDVQLAYLCELEAVVEFQLKMLRSTPLSSRYSCEEHRLNGLISSICRCLEAMSFGSGTNIDLGCWTAFAIRLEKLLSSVVVVSMEMHKDNSVAFIEGCANQIVEEDIDLYAADSGHRALTVISWHTVKAAVQTLSVLATLSVPLLADSILEQICQVFITDVLLAAKHSGIVLHTHLALERITKRMLLNGDENSAGFQAVSSSIESLLKLLRNADPRDRTWIRRSAGLPFCFIALLRSEPRSRPRRFLFHVSAELLRIVSSSSSSVPARVHSLNCIRALFRDRELGLHMLGFAAETFRIAIIGFQDSQWAIRNASLMCFASVTGQVFHEGAAAPVTSTDSSNRITGLFFFQRLQELRVFFMEQMQVACSDLVRVHPSLHPILTLLVRFDRSKARLTDEISAAFIPLLQRATQHCHYMMRATAARAMCALVPLSDRSSTLVRLLMDLPRAPHATLRLNSIHGLLLQAKTLMLHDVKVLPGALEALRTRLWLASEQMSSSIVRLEALQTFYLLLREQPKGQAMFKQLQLMLIDASASGNATLLRREAVSLFASFELPRDLCSETICRALADSHVADVQAAAVSAISMFSDVSGLNTKLIISHLVEIVVSSRVGSWQAGAAVRAIVHLQVSHSQLQSLANQAGFVRAVVALCQQSADALDLLVLLFEVDAVEVPLLVSELEHAVRYERDEKLRFAGVAGVRHSELLSTSSSHRKVEDRFQVRLWCTVIHALQDQSVKVRAEAERCVDAVTPGISIDVHPRSFSAIRVLEGADDALWQMLASCADGIEDCIKAGVDRSTIYREDAVNEFVEPMILVQMGGDALISLKLPSSHHLYEKAQLAVSSLVRCLKLLRQSSEDVADSVYVKMSALAMQAMIFPEALIHCSDEVQAAIAVFHTSRSFYHPAMKDLLGRLGEALAMQSESNAPACG